VAVGFLECAGFGTVLYAMDKACKAAAIEIIGIDTINPKDAKAFIPLTAQAKFEGGTDDVKAACEYARRAALELAKPEDVLTEIIERPFEGTKKLARITKTELRRIKHEKAPAAVGVLEISYFSNTIVAVDHALKTADVKIVSCHKKLGGKMCHTVLAGMTSEVQAAVEAVKEAGRLIGEQNIKTAVVICSPHPEIKKILNMNKKRIQGGTVTWQKQQEQKEVCLH